MKVKTRSIPRHVFGATIVCLLATLPALPAAADVSAWQNSVLRILCIVTDSAGNPVATDSTTGSGFVVAADEANTYIATNAHVIACLDKPNAQAMLALGPQTQLPLSIDKADTDRDLAILRAPHFDGHPPVRFADTSNLLPGLHVVAIGFPGAADEVLDEDDAADTTPTLTEGNIGRIITGSDNGVRYIQHSAAINPGNSGGPLFNDSGAVIGINTLKALQNTVGVDADGNPEVDRTVNGEGIGMAVDAAQVMALMREVGLTPQMGYPFGVSPVMLALVAGLATLTLLGGATFATPMGRSLVLGRRGGPAGAGQRQQARLRVVSGALSGTERGLAQAVVIGRDASQAQLVFPADEPGVSRRHCKIRFDAASGMFEVTDLASSSGTFVDAGGPGPQRIPPNVTQRLQPGQRIYVGSRHNCVALETA